jgi:hypothetical protein
VASPGRARSLPDVMGIKFSGAAVGGRAQIRQLAQGLARRIAQSYELDT